MRLAPLERAGLICPVCRAGSLRADTAVTGGPEAVQHGIFRCDRRGCGAAHPIIDGIPILVEDWLAYAQSERWIILRRRDLPCAITRMLDAPLGDDDAERIRQRHLESYRLSHFGPLSPEVSALGGEFAGFLAEALGNWLKPTDRPALALDAGCATGGYTRMLAGHVDFAIGIDLHFERVRLAAEQCLELPGAAFLVANAQNPPFEPGAFDVVFALNLLDAVARPRQLLENLKNCLRAGGLLFLTTPFDYSTVYSAREEWVAEPELAQWLERDFEILKDRQRLPWVLPIHPRRSDVFFVRALVARKRIEPC